MADDDLRERLRAAAETCDRAVFGHARRTPAEVLGELAVTAADLGVTWDRYGERGAVALVEERLGELFGTERALFFPSGTMAQQCALRVWCDRAGSRRVALPDLSHLLVHELDGPRLLQGLEVEHLTAGPVVATADHLAALRGRLAAVLVELPLRGAGCLLPEWDELVELSVAVRARGAAFHVDGARIWESRAFWDRSWSEVAALADTMYVSFYKGLGGIAGAALLGPADVLEEAARWRKRMGGTLFHLTAEAVSALAGLERHLPRLEECLAWSRSLAAELTALGVAVTPDPPHTPTFVVHAGAGADEVNRRVLAFLEREGLQLTGAWTESDEPGRSRTELVCSTPALEHAPARVAGWLAEVVSG